MKRNLFVLMHLFFMVGCAAPPTEVGITATPATEAQVTTSTAVVQATETATVSVATEWSSPTAWPTQTQLPPLSEEGPWRVYDEDGEIYATNADGSGYLIFHLLRTPFGVIWLLPLKID